MSSDRLSAAAVAAGNGRESGGFVGIVAPHLVRPAVGHDPARSLLPAALLGALLLVLADTLVRVLPTGTELRLGVVAALVGAPLFVRIALQRGAGHG